MIDNRIVHNLHLEFRKDKRVVRQVAYHPITFVKSKIVDDEDWNPIRIRYCGVFLPKTKHVVEEL